MIGYLASLTAHLGLLALMLLAALGLGDLALRKQRFDSVLERVVFTVALGLGFWALMLFALGVDGLLYRVPIAMLTALGAREALPVVRRLYRSTDDSPRADVRGGLLIAAAGCAVWLVLLQLPLYPPMNWDSTAYHLVLVREYLFRHAVTVHTGVVLPVLPALNHMLFAWAVALGGDVLAQLVEHTFMMLTALALYTWGVRRRRRGLAVAAAAFWLGQPLVLWLGESAYVDVANAGYAFLGVYALRVFWDGRDARWWWLGMALLAMAAGVRIHGLVFLAMGGAIGLWAWLRSNLGWRALVEGWTAGLLIAGPWYAFVGVHTGNPFWPAVAWLSHGVWRPGSEFAWQAFGHVGVPKTLLNFLSLPLRLGLDPAPFLPDNNRGLLPIVAALPVAWAIAFVDRSVRWWTCWALAYTAFWFLSSQQIRFWIAALPLAVLALYEAVQWILERTGASRAVTRVVWMVLALFALQAGVRLTLEVTAGKGWPPPVTAHARQTFLAGRYPGYAAVTHINQRASPSDVVYSLNASWLNYYLTPRVVDFSGLLQMSPRPSFRWPDDQAWVRKLEAEGVTWILVNHTGVPMMADASSRNPAVDPFWPDYALVYADPVSWVFRRKPALSP